MERHHYFLPFELDGPLWYHVSGQLPEGGGPDGSFKQIRSALNGLGFVEMVVHWTPGVYVDEDGDCHFCRTKVFCRREEGGGSQLVLVSPVEKLLLEYRQKDDPGTVGPSK